MQGKAFIDQSLRLSDCRQLFQRSSQSEHTECPPGTHCLEQIPVSRSGIYQQQQAAYGSDPEGTHAADSYSAEAYSGFSNNTLRQQSCRSVEAESEASGAPSPSVDSKSFVSIFQNSLWTPEAHTPSAGLRICFRYTSGDAEHSRSMPFGRPTTAYGAVKNKKL